MPRDTSAVSIMLQPGLAAWRLETDQLPFQGRMGGR